MQFAQVPKHVPLTWRSRAKRLYIVLAILGFGGLAVIGRLSFLQVANKDFLNQQGDARTIRTVTIPTYRGLITDRRGTPLAVSTPVDSVWVNPKHFQPTQFQMTQLSRYLELPAHDITTKIKQHQQRGFVYLKRQVTPDKSSQIKKLNIPGLNLQREFKRYYPAGPITAQLLGFTDIDDNGQAGIELAFDEQLKPVIGKKRVLEDRMGRWVKDINHSKLAKEGENLALSIDLRIQTLAYNALDEAVKKLKAKSGTLTMIDVQTGEVLAMVSVPSFNPNLTHERQGAPVRNRAMTDQIEPGSTIKPLSMVSLLEHGSYQLLDEIDTNPGYYRIGQHLVRDVRNYGKLKINQILVKSSNIGLSKLIVERPAEELIDTFSKFGFGQPVVYRFPGEMAGKLPPAPKNPFVTATLSFGYALTTTPLQLAHAYTILAQRGLKRPISITKLEDDNIPKGEQVLKPESTEDVVGMLVQVMNSTGTGRRARINGYKTAGKTGTTRLVGPQGYDKNRHNALFVGFTPVDEPRLATVVLIEEPDEEANHYYGGVAAAPVYAEVVKGALHMLNVPPDNA